MATMPLAAREAAHVRAALAAASRGALTTAIAEAEAALALAARPGPIRGLAGMLRCQAGDLAGGIAQLRRAHAEEPDDTGIATNLVTALMQSGDEGGALAVAQAGLAGSDGSGRLGRMRAYLLQQAGDHAGAAAAYEALVSDHPADFESWNNLGNARAAAGDHAGSIAALEQAAGLVPDSAPIRINLATTLLETGESERAEHILRACIADFPDDATPLVELAGLLKQTARDEEALAAIAAAAALRPDDRELQIKLGLEQLTGWDMAGAEASFRRAAMLAPADAEAYLLLAVLYEHHNRPDMLAGLIAEALANGADPASLSFVRALQFRREKRFAEGLAALALVPPDVEPVRCAQLRAQFHDRLGERAQAFAAFSEMNRQLRRDPSDPDGRAERYRAGLADQIALLTPEWVATLPAVRDARPGRSARRPAMPDPVFLVGFPRSGTTLLDTMLMGHPAADVMEELPHLNRVERALGGWDRLPALGPDDRAALRDLYFAEAAKGVALSPDRLLIDKSPLYLTKVPLILQLFPGARFILALRHPCDVVLSCFMTNFRLNSAMANFTALDTAAALYDLSFCAWDKATTLFDVARHAVRYEAMVADTAGELRPLFAWLGLDWHEAVLDHRETAAARGIISTASYAQVTEPIYTRAAGRWEAYRDQLAPVMPVLQPWAERHGYAC